MGQNVKQVHISELEQDRANANKGSERGTYMLETSFREVGAGRSILIDKHGRIIAGNKSAEQAAALGLDDVIVVESDGTKLIAVQRTDLDLYEDERARKLAYYDNRTSDFMTWDAEQILADLNAGVDLDQFWRKDELDELLADLQPKTTGDTPAEVDRAEELRQKWGTCAGQLWALGEHRLVCGDCTDAATVARVMGGERADLLLTDPPYGVSYADKNAWLNAVAFGNRIQTPIENDHGTIEETARNVWLPAFSLALECCCDTAAFYVFMPQGGDQMMMMMMMSEAGWMPRHELIWLKNNHVLGRADYNYKHEPILYGWKRKGTHHYYGGFQVSVIECNKPQNSDMHPTMKPLELIERLIPNNTQDGAIVYEPFAGSGTVIIACENLGRQARVIEIDAGYAATCLERWSVHTGRQPVLVDI